MISDLGQLRASLHDTALADAELSLVEIPSSREPVIEVVFDRETASEEAAWRVARSLSPRIGRWPLFFMDRLADHSLDSPEDAHAVRTLMGATTREEAEKQAREFGRMNWPCAGEIDLVVAEWEGGGPPLSVEEVRGLLPPNATYRDLREQIFAAVLRRDPDLSFVDTDPSTLEIYSAPQSSRGPIHLLPVSEGHFVPSLLQFFDYEEPVGLARLGANFERWRHQYGAEIFAAWPWEFFVDRPPTTLAEAGLLTQDHIAVGSDHTPGNFPHGELGYAKSLVGARKWWIFNF